MAWNGSTNVGGTTSAPKKPAKKSPGLTHGLIAGAAIVLIGIIALYFVTSETDENPVEKKGPSKIAEVEPAIAQKLTPKAEKSAPTEKAEKLEWKDEYITDSAMRLKFSTLIQARTNEGGMVTERFRLPNGKTWRRVTDPPPIFPNRCDMAIVRTMSEEAGVPIPPVPGLDDADLDEEFAKSLLEPIVINDDDSPRVAALKLIVKETRAEIARLIKEGDGRSVGEILQDHINLNNHMADMQGDAIRQYDKVKKESGVEVAKEFLVKINENLASYGIDPICIDSDDDAGDESPEEGVVQQ